MTDTLSTLTRAREGLLTLVSDVRPELHRYCARLTGSVIEGEDIVQDTLAKAFYAMSMSPEVPPAAVALQDRAPGATEPAYFILLSFEADRVSNIRDFRYIPYIAREAEYELLR
jgi:hypothetical protein